MCVGGGRRPVSYPSHEGGGCEGDEGCGSRRENACRSESILYIVRARVHVFCSRANRPGPGPRPGRFVILHARLDVHGTACMRACVLLADGCNKLARARAGPVSYSSRPSPTEARRPGKRGAMRVTRIGDSDW